MNSCANIWFKEIRGNNSLKDMHSSFWNKCEICDQFVIELSLMTGESLLKLFQCLVHNYNEVTGSEKMLRLLNNGVTVEVWKSSKIKFLE